jgi:hypothetical protein
LVIAAGDGGGAGVSTGGRWQAARRDSASSPSIRKADFIAERLKLDMRTPREHERGENQDETEQVTGHGD